MIDLELIGGIFKFFVLKELRRAINSSFSVLVSLVCISLARYFTNPRRATCKILTGLSLAPSKPEKIIKNTKIEFNKQRMVIGFHTKNRTTYFSAPRKD
jgi:hypothetical protein